MAQESDRRKEGELDIWKYDERGEFRSEREIYESKSGVGELYWPLQPTG